MEHIEQHYLEKEFFQQLAADPTIFKFIQTNCLDGLFFWDLENQEHQWMSENFWKVFGFDSADKQHLASEWKEIVFRDDFENAMANFKKHCDNPEQPYDQIVRYRHSDGSVVWVRCRGMAIRDEQGKPVRMLGVHQDITQQKRTEEQLRKKIEEVDSTARHDAFTNLYNKPAFAEIFEQQLLIAAREHMPISLAILDIDDYKGICDTLGDEVGGRVLLDISGTLAKVARDSDVIGRFGRSRFIVLMFNTNHREAHRAAERLRTGVEESVIADKSNVTVSVGVSTFGEKSIAGIDMSPAEIYDMMLESTNKALDKAIENGRNQVCY